MKWVQSCLRNQRMICLFIISMLLVGAFCLSIITVSPFPSIAFNQINIQLNYPGANADTVQTQITNKVENALLGIANIQYMTATSRTGNASINLTLESMSPNDLLETQIQIMQAIASSHLPTTVQQPIITINTGYSSLVTYIVYSNKISLFDIDNFIQSVLYPKFSSLPGVSLFNTTQNPIVSIQLHPAKLAEYQLNVSKIATLLDNINQSNPLGELYLAKKSYVLNSPDVARSLNDFSNLVVGYQNQDIGQPILLKQIAGIVFTTRSLIPTYYSSFNGHTADGISLYTKSDANPFQVFNSAQQYVDSISESLPKDMKIFPISNMAKVMSDAFRELLSTVGIATVLVLLIALLFLGHLKTTLIPIITIPVCLLGAVIFLAVFGMSLNILTLLAMVIAVGLVVDDAIVVLENITRHLEEGFKKSDAVLHGTADIAKTIVGITITLLAVYLPIVFCNGGPFTTLLKGFSIPLAVAVLISGVVALTLTPVMCAHLISDAPPNRYQIWFTKLLHKIIKIYQTALLKILKKPLVSLSVLVALILIGAYVALKQPREFFPADPSNAINVTINGNSTDDVESIQQKMKQFSLFYKDKKVDYYDVDIRNDPMTGLLRGVLEIQYQPQFLRENSAFSDQINQYIHSQHLQDVSAQMEKWSNAGNGADLSIVIYGGDDVQKINSAAQQITNKMKTSAFFTTVTNSIQEPQIQLQFNINDIKANQLGIDRPQIMQLLSTCFGGYTLNNYFNIAGLSVPIVVGLAPEDLQGPSNIEKLQIQNNQTGQFYPLDTFVSIQTIARPNTISTMNNQSSVEIDANLAKGHSLSEGIFYLKQLLQTQTPNLLYQFIGNAQVFLQGNNQTLFIILLGIVCIYLLLAILFNSFADPFIILLTVPFSVIGGAVSLALVSGSINLYSAMGFITLVGLITKHGVLIVQFANQRIEKGEKDIIQAILLATHHRFRPILMTTLAMTLGALPLVLSHKLMYVAKQDLGIVIIGGLIIGTFFSLFIVPLVYLLIKKIEVQN